MITSASDKEGEDNQPIFASAAFPHLDVGEYERTEGAGEKVVTGRVAEAEDLEICSVFVWSILIFFWIF